MHRAGARETGPFPLGTLPEPPGTAGGLFRLLRRLGRRGRLNRGGFFSCPGADSFHAGMLRPALKPREGLYLQPLGRRGVSLRIQRRQLFDDGPAKPMSVMAAMAQLVRLRALASRSLSKGTVRHRHAPVWPKDIPAHRPGGGVLSYQDDPGVLGWAAEPTGSSPMAT